MASVGGTTLNNNNIHNIHQAKPNITPTSFSTIKSSHSNPSVSYEPFAPRSEAQRSRLARIALLTAGPTAAASSTNTHANASSPTKTAMPPSLLLTAMSKSSTYSSSSSSHENEYEAKQSQSHELLLEDEKEDASATFSATHILKYAQSTSSHLSKCLEQSAPVRTNLQKSIQICQTLMDRHTQLLQHSGELSAAAERLQIEEQMLSQKAKEIGAPLEHYDAMDKMGVLVGVLFKDEGNTVVRGLAKVKVDSEEYVDLLDQIDLALEFFTNQYRELNTIHQNQIRVQQQRQQQMLHGGLDDPNLTERERERERRRREREQRRNPRKESPLTGSVVEYYKRSLALHDAALFLIREAVVDRLTQTTNDINAALNLTKTAIPADKLEASLIYTRFHGISSRSNSLITILRDRLGRDHNNSYNELLTLCQSTYSKSREILLKLTVKEHMDLLKTQHGLINMTRLASVFLIRICTVETLLYLDFFAGDYKSEEKEEKSSTQNNDDSNSNTALHLKPSYKRKKSKSEKAAILATQDPYFQKHLSNLCTHLHKTVRRGLIAVNDLDTLCQIVSVLREEWSLANSSKNTVATARALSGVIQDAQERLIFCANNALNKEVNRFKASPADLDYPNKLMKKNGENDDTTLASNESGTDDNGTSKEEHKEEGETNASDAVLDDAVKAQLKVYEAWFPPMRSVLRILSKIFRVVEPRVFEDIAQQSVYACTKCLKEGAATILTKSGILHADLFIVKHLLILREQLSPFDIQLRSVERQLDFSETGKAVTKFLANRNRKLFSMTNENALVTLLREGVSVQEANVDSKRDLEDSLRSACNDFIEHTSQTLAKSLMAFIEDCKSVVNTTGVLKGEPHMQAGSVITTLSNTLDSIGEESGIIISQMSLYLENTATQSILMKPVVRKILRALEDSKRYMSEVNGENNTEANGSEDDKDGWNPENREQVVKLMSEIETKVRALTSSKSSVFRQN